MTDTTADRAALRDRIAEDALAAVEAALGDTLVPAAREEALAGIVAVLPPADQADELTAEEARALADDLGLQLYRAQDALAFVAECCTIAERDQRAITTADVREWLKGAQCGRQLAAGDAELRRMADEPSAAEAQRPERDQPVYLSTPCAACTHPYNWHCGQPQCQASRNGDLCSCRSFTPGDEPAAGAWQDGAAPPGLRERHRAAWNDLTPEQQAARLAELDADADAEQDGAQP